MLLPPVRFFLKRINTPAILMVAITGAGCVTLFPARKHEISLTQDSVVVEGAKAPFTKASGENLLLGEVPILVQAPGYISVLLVPVSGKNNSIKLTMKPIEKWSGNFLEKKNDAMMDDLLTGVNEIQMELAAGNSRTAEIKLEDLKKSYPGVSFLKFLEASTLVIAGNTTKAIHVLESALTEFPEHKMGRELYQTLTNRKWNGRKSQ